MWQQGMSIRMRTTGVIFDMDGTLTEENAIDFQAMYDRIGLVKRGDDIITQVKEDLDGERQQRAFDIIVEEELFGCDRMIIKDDLEHCINFLSDNNIKMAISTRNCRQGIVFSDFIMYDIIFVERSLNVLITSKLFASIHCNETNSSFLPNIIGPHFIHFFIQRMTSLPRELTFTRTPSLRCLTATAWGM
jgi:hypothetical protein